VPGQLSNKMQGRECPNLRVVESGDSGSCRYGVCDCGGVIISRCGEMTDRGLQVGRAKRARLDRAGP
jgi:hypothetical protein